MSFPLYLDENVDVQVAIRLRHDGYDVLTALQVDLTGSSDEAQLEYAAMHGRAFVTHDLKTIPALLRQWWAGGKEHAGVIFCEFRSPAEIHERLRNLLECYDRNDLRNVTLWLP